MSPTAILDELCRLSTATIFEAVPGLEAMSPVIRQMVEGARFAGPACTACCQPGDNTAVTRAVAAAKAGEVVVIDAGGPPVNAVWGTNASYACALKGVVGMVTNGAVRDLDDIRRQGFPVFAAGVSVRGSVKHEPGWVGVAVSVGGAVVCPGDIVVGDTDGVVIIPAARLDEVVAAALRRKAEEDTRAARLRAGESLASVVGGG
ncbi:MAG: 4-hydroxy-4-methyl-2-oxoglutarate aldolase [Alphaproteobacteria bacterium]|nr:4-hydroxy-4-methyl-2-oxoglutarate aldolase [Alphaproteobacteria bacterium]